MEQNLPELRDIHLPEGVSAFPPAYGWWVILGGILLLLLLTELFLIVRRKSKNAMLVSAGSCSSGECGSRRIADV